MPDISKIVVHYTDGTTQEVGSGAGAAQKVLVEYRTDRTKDGNFRRMEDSSKVVSNGREFAASKVKPRQLIGRYRITALSGPIHIKRVDVDNTHGLTVRGIRNGMVLNPGDAPIVFDATFGPVENLHVGTNDQGWFSIETSEAGVIVKDGFRLAKA